MPLALYSPGTSKPARRSANSGNPGRRDFQERGTPKTEQPAVGSNLNPCILMFQCLHIDNFMAIMLFFSPILGGYACRYNIGIEVT